MLGWIETPQLSTCADLDSHLFTSFDCDPFGRPCTAPDIKAEKDRDDSDWGGPETITVVETNSAHGVYNHYVYIYGEGVSYVGSKAHVSAYSDQGLLSTVAVEDGPTTAPGVSSNWLFWHTFRYPI